MFYLLELLGEDAVLSTLAVLGLIVFFFYVRNALVQLRFAVGMLQRDVAELKRDAARAEEWRPVTPPVADDAATIVTPPSREMPESVATVDLAHDAAETTADEAFVPPPPPVSPPPITPSRPAAGARRKQFEQQFGGRAFVWVGGVALALAGFYLVKYSIDTGLLTEQVRVVLGVLFGLALLGASYAVRARPGLANGTRIGQALAGAGIADLYGSLFAATTLYHLLPPWLGFSAMAVTTAVALVLSLRHGAPIAALGLLGGYATPALISSGEPDAAILFSYLYLVFAGTTGVIRQRNWWWLSVPATLVAFAWVALWLVDGGAAHDAAWLSSFLFAIGATAVFAERRTTAQPDASRGGVAPDTWRRGLAPGGALALMGLVAWTADFGLFQWAMFALFSAGAIGLAWFDGRTYSFVPWQAMGVNLLLLAFGWSNAPPDQFAIVVTGFALLFALSGQVLLSRSEQPLSWGGLSATAALLYFLLAHDQLDGDLAAALQQSALNPDMVWAGIAFAAAGLMAFACGRPFVLTRERVLRQRLQAVFAVAATSLVSLGFAILLHQEYLSLALAGEVLALAWIASRVEIPALTILAQVLCALYALSAAEDVTRTLLGAADTSASEPLSMALLSNVFFRFAVPAALFWQAAAIIRRRGENLFVRVLELGSVALLTVTLYKLFVAAFFGHPTAETLAIGSLFTILVFGMSIAALRLAPLLRRDTMHWAGLALGAFACFRVVACGFLVFNPLIAHQYIGPLPLLNALLTVYGLPAVLLWFASREAKGPAILLHASAIAAYALGFVCLTLMVRQLFNGPFLDSGEISNAEVYAYSALWLAIGVALLFSAAVLKDQTMRFGSLFVMLLTVGKVFLYDASQLTGLWRVVSFLGLGLSLLVLSWFYSRFIFVSDETAAAD